MKEGEGTLVLTWLVAGWLACCEDPWMVLLLSNVAA